jgi:hypothetical protein
VLRLDLNSYSYGGHRWLLVSGLGATATLCGMRRILDRSQVVKELTNVAEKLDAGLPMDKRLVLLRRQAQLGDLLDAIDLKARRQAV